MLMTKAPWINIAGTVKPSGILAIPPDILPLLPKRFYWVVRDGRVSFEWHPGQVYHPANWAALTQEGS